MLSKFASITLVVRVIVAEGDEVPFDGLVIVTKGFMVSMANNTAADTFT